MNQWIQVLPELILSTGATALLIISGLAQTGPMRDLLRWLASFTIVAAGATLIVLSGKFGLSDEGWTLATPFTTSVSLVLLTLIGWAALAGPVPAKAAGEWFALLLFAALGSVILARVANLPALFLGIEVLSLSLYVLVAFRYTRKLNLKAGAMYLVLAGFGSSFLIYGMALIYTVYGTLSISELANQAASTTMPLLGSIGYGMFLVGVGFKLAAVPFHMWAPDVYEAAPSVATGIIASASKGATIAALLPFAFLLNSHYMIIATICGASMIIGNWLGLRETRVKRILAYSSVAHVGYLLLAFTAMKPTGENASAVLPPLSLESTLTPAGAILFYIVVYGLAALGAFTAIGYLRDKSTMTLSDLHGLAAKQPLVSACLLIFIISMAGLPISAGFWGKLYLFSAAFQANLYKLAIIGLIGSAIGIFYYLRILVHLYMVAPETNPRGEFPEVTVFQKTLLTLAAIATIVFSVFPEWLHLLLRAHL